MITRTRHLTALVLGTVLALGACATDGDAPNVQIIDNPGGGKADGPGDASDFSLFYYSKATGTDFPYRHLGLAVGPSTSLFNVALLPNHTFVANYNVGRSEAGGTQFDDPNVVVTGAWSAGSTALILNGVGTATVTDYVSPISGNHISGLAVTFTNDLKGPGLVGTNVVELLMRSTGPIDGMPQ